MAVTDTHPDALARQIELLRAAGPVRRVAVALRLTDDVRAMSRRALRRCHPEAGDRELKRLFAELHYGKEQSKRLLGG